MTDPFSMLESDHRQVEQLLSQLSESEEGPERTELVDHLTSALQLHMDFEETNVYPLTREILDGETVEEAETEHSLARDGLAKLSELVTAPGFGAAVAMLQGGIEHHVEEEEGEVFPALRKSVDSERQSDLARQLLTAKRDAGMLAASLDNASKDDLVEMAKGLGLDARSSMTKDQLRQLVESSAS